MKKTLGIFTALLVVFSLAGCLILPGFSQGVFYYPSAGHNTNTPEHDGLVFEDITFQSLDGTQLHGWFVPAVPLNSAKEATAQVDAIADEKTKATLELTRITKATENTENTQTTPSVVPTANTQPPIGTVIFVHGNAADISVHWPLANWLPKAGFNVFIFDYRGFGHSKGRPNFKGTFQDTLAAFAYVRQRPDVNPNHIFIIGQSLGGNNAIAALGSMGREERNGICALMVDSTFYSYSSIAVDKFYPFIKYFITDKYSASTHIKSLQPMPLLFLHGSNDLIIPLEQGQRLFDIAPEPKEFILIPQGEHITALSPVYGDKYQNIVADFFKQSLSSCATP